MSHEWVVLGENPQKIFGGRTPKGLSSNHPFSGATLVYLSLRECIYYIVINTKRKINGNLHQKKLYTQHLLGKIFASLASMFFKSRHTMWGFKLEYMLMASMNSLGITRGEKMRRKKRDDTKNWHGFVTDQQHQQRRHHHHHHHHHQQQQHILGACPNPATVGKSSSSQFHQKRLYEPSLSTFTVFKQDQKTYLLPLGSEFCVHILSAVMTWVPTSSNLNSVSSGLRMATWNGKSFT